VPPDPGGQIQDPPNAAQLLVNGPGRHPGRATGFAVLCQRIVVNAIEGEIADVRQDAIEGVHVPVQTLFVLIVVEILDRCLLKRPCRSNAVDHCLANFVEAVR
jgi:hypothetical protein